MWCTWGHMWPTWVSFSSSQYACFICFSWTGVCGFACLSSFIRRKLLSRITALNYWYTIVFFEQVLCNPYLLCLYTTLEAGAKISCLMCSDSKKSTDVLWGVLHSALLVAITNSEERADDYLFTHAHHHALRCNKWKLQWRSHLARLLPFEPVTPMIPPPCLRHGYCLQKLK